MNKEIKTISPFKNFCMTIGALPTSYLESMSYYETLCWLCKYLENTINPAINQNAEALKELQEYVANYFDNLDVTEEINNKLDEMADDGTLAEIINVEMIGSLSNLTTTDKTDLVSAINEVKSDTDDINDKINDINLTHYETFDKDSITIVSGCSALSDDTSITVASNESGSLCKVYGMINPTTVANSNSFDITIQCRLRPTSYFLVNPAGLIRRTAGAGNEVVRTCYMSFAPDGTIRIYGTIVNEADFGVYLWPCIYFVKDFGDES